ncbi:MAG: cytochrome b/b6 domain-containing protein [Candidatus Dadabacteria bacterium]|nr:MAG: cytochrome b/b6 domain-containing protein [Candidatus Dadabacteria bacterium]
MTKETTSLAEDLAMSQAQVGEELDLPVDLAEPWASYPWLHFFYAVVALGLVATGLLIQFPDLRARFVGGYGQTLAWWHEWAGVAMLVLPALWFAVSPSAAWETLVLRSWRRDKLALHAVNLWFTIVSGIVFVVTGFLLWFQRTLPDPVIDWSYVLHDVFSYALYVMIPIHVVISLGRTVRNLRARLGRLRLAVTGGQELEKATTSREGLTCW